MKRNELAEVKKMTIKAVEGKIEEAYHKIERLVMDKNMNKLTNTCEIKNKRRDLAQLLTVMKQKKLLEKLEDQNAGK